MSMMPPRDVSKVLLIDDDEKFCDLLSDYLDAHAMSIRSVHDGKSGLEAVRTGGFDLVLLDMFLPDMHGVEVLRFIRMESAAPVVILSAHNEETDRIVTLEMGADDYVPKTFSSRELLARIRAVLRRHSGPQQAVQESSELDLLRLRGLVLNDRTKEATLDSVPLDFTAMEFRLLWIMVQQAGRVFTREDLLGIIAERDFNKFDRSVDVHISSLRQKLGDDSRCPQYIKTLRGIGYSIIR